MLTNLFPNADWNEIGIAILQTLYMTAVSVIATFILGIILGLLLFVTDRGNLIPNSAIYKIIAAVVNLFRSIPFIILIILLIPFTTFIVGTMLGSTAALPALIIGSAPFYARLVEIALREIDKGVIEAAQSMGATRLQIVFKVLLPEAMPALVSGITVTAITLVSFTAMAGVVGAGGLGTLAYNEGYERGNQDVTVLSTFFILVIVFLLQILGDFVTRLIDKR